METMNYISVSLIASSVATNVARETNRLSRLVCPLPAGTGKSSANGGRKDWVCKKRTNKKNGSHVRKFFIKIEVKRIAESARNKKWTAT